uniref:Uncharacterized protein n=1 Tax=Anopheles atroparvus TaxID=41427 RepID=A0A182J6X2_ANOAO
MDLPDSDLTEMALQIMGYQMYDQNGTPTDSFSQVMQPRTLADTLQTGVAAANKDLPACSNRDTQRDEKKFMAEFGILDEVTVLEKPNQYVEGQMASLLEQLEARILRTKTMKRSKNKANALREKNAQANEKEIACFCNNLQQLFKAAKWARKAEIGDTWSQADQAKRKAHEAKLVEQIEEFNMLLELLKIILDEIPDDWRELDKIWQLLKKSIDMI